MTRADRIKYALETLKAIEDEIAAKIPRGVPGSPSGAIFQASVNNAVALYCARDVSESVANTGPI